MAQFYFLSILLNVAAGLILVYGVKLSYEEKQEVQEAKPAKKGSRKSKTSETAVKEVKKEDIKDDVAVTFKNAPFLNDRTMRLVIGVLCAFVGVMKLLTVFKGDVPVVGDLFPSLAGLLGGASLILEYYLNTTTEPVELPQPVTAILVDSRRYVGFACLLASLLHFVFPGVLLL